jgi:predicted secreted protein
VCKNLTILGQLAMGAPASAWLASKMRLSLRKWRLDSMKRPMEKHMNLNSFAWTRVRHLAAATILGAICLSAASLAQAGDRANFQLLGFSTNNAYVAFSEHGTNDGSAFAYAKVIVVDTKLNKEVLRKSLEATDESVTEYTVLNALVAKTNLAKFAIRVGQNLGETLFTQTQSTNPNPLIFTAHPTAGGSTVPRYGIDVHTQVVTIPSTLECPSETPPEFLNLRLFSAANAPKALNKVIQNDHSLSHVRGCASKYTVSQIIKSGKALLIVVGYQQPGFEDPSYRFMAVTTQATLY